MKSNPFKTYQESVVHGCSAAEVFIQCYDEIIRLLHSAARAIEKGDIENKTRDLNRVLAFIVHLQGALNSAQGDEVGQWLNHFYGLVRKQVFEASVQLRPDLLRQAAGYFADVRKMWEGARATDSGNPASISAYSPQDDPFRTPQKVAPAIAPDMAGTSSPTDWSA